MDINKKKNSQVARNSGAGSPAMQMDGVKAEHRAGKLIYGDDFSLREIESWFADEAEGYAEIVPEGHGDFYEYECVTEMTLYRWLRKTGQQNLRLLSYGGGYGTELLPILDLVSDITVLEPSEKFKTDQIGGKPCRYVKPAPSGKMAFEDNSFDCILCLGVLHHVPNVSYILREFFRVLRENGILMIREPITSMHVFDGIYRPGATKRERGLPLGPFRQAIRDAGLKIHKETLYGFGPLSAVKRRIGWRDRTWIIRLDIALSKMFQWNYSYDSGSNLMIWKKFRPTNVAFFIRKEEKAPGVLT